MNLAERVCHCGESSVESSSTGDNREGSGGMEVEIADRMEDPPQELILVIEEDSNDIPILEENWDPIPVPPPRIRNTENVEIVEMASQVTLGARAPIISGHMLNTLRIQSISDHNVSNGQKSDTFKMYPVM